MQTPMPGSTVVIIDGPFNGFSGLVKSVSETDIIVEVEFFGRKTPVKLTSKDIRAMDQIYSLQDEYEEEGPFRVGDTVFVCESPYGQPANVGQIGSVIAVLSEMQKCLVDLGEGGQQRVRGYYYFQIGLIQPERRPPDEDYLRAISAAIPMRGYGPRLTQWWQEQADKKTWSIEEMADLHAAYLVFKAGIDAEIAAEIERHHHLFQQAFSGLTHAQKVEKWQAEWSSWTEYRSYIKLDEEGEKYHSSGSELRERCEGHMARLSKVGYAYDTIPFRSVSFEATAGETASLLSAAPMAPVPSRRIPLLEREQALAALEDEGKRFSEALVSLTSDADDKVVDALLEKYISLRSQEGFDRKRYHRVSSLALALLTTQREDAVLAVLHARLEGELYTPYRVQGVMLKERARPLFWHENPWQIRADEDVQSAIARIWAPVTRYVPHFVASLCKYVIGLALVKQEQVDMPYLVYLLLIPYSSCELREYDIVGNAPTQTQNLLDWFGLGVVSTLLGYPPRDPNDDRLEHLPDFRLPLALRELYTIHGGLSSSSGRLLEPEHLDNLLDWINQDNKDYYLNHFHVRNAGLLPEQFVEVACDISGNASVFDRDLLDDRLDPQVADWDHETWEVSGPSPFWSWFDDYIPYLLLGLEY